MNWDDLFAGHGFYRRNAGNSWAVANSWANVWYRVDLNLTTVWNTSIPRPRTMMEMMVYENDNMQFWKPIGSVRYYDDEANRVGELIIRSLSDKSYTPTLAGIPGAEHIMEHLLK